MQLVMAKLKDIPFLRASEHLGITPLTGKFVKKIPHQAHIPSLLLL